MIFFLWRLLRDVTHFVSEACDVWIKQNWTGLHTACSPVRHVYRGPHYRI